MNFSYEARLVSGITLLTIPTVMYGGWIMVGLLIGGIAGSAPERDGAKPT